MSTLFANYNLKTSLLYGRQINQHSRVEFFFCLKRTMDRLPVKVEKGEVEKRCSGTDMQSCRDAWTVSV